MPTASHKTLIALVAAQVAAGFHHVLGASSVAWSSFPGRARCCCSLFDVDQGLVVSLVQGLVIAYRRLRCVFQAIRLHTGVALALHLDALLHAG
jgi:hypothetical protein